MELQEAAFGVPEKIAAVCLGWWHFRLWIPAKAGMTARTGATGRSPLQVRKSDMHASQIREEGLQKLASMSKTFCMRRLWRSSPENSADAKALAISLTSSSPIMRAPMQRTFMSSCSTPWCAE